MIAVQFTIPYACTKPPFRMMLRLPYAGMLAAEGALTTATCVRVLPPRNGLWFP